MRAAIGVVLILLTVTSGAAAQSAEDKGRQRPSRWSIGAGGGVALPDVASDVSVSVGFAPVERIDLIVGAERAHLPFRRKVRDDGVSVTRGGTLTFVSAEVRGWLRPRDRVSPFLAAGAGTGISRPTVNAHFPDEVRNDLRVVYLGGGVRVPFGRSLEVWGDARAMLALEGYDSVFGMWPIRAGVTWRF